MSASTERRLHIGIDASRIDLACPTGTETYSFQIIRALLLAGRQHAYTLYARRPLPPALLATAPHPSCRVLGPPRLWTHLGLSFEMLRQPPDVLFVPAHVLPIIRPQHSVVTVHDLGYLYYPAAHPRARRWHLHLSTAYHVRVATRLIADSATTKADLVRWYGADAAKITVVPLAVGDHFRPVRDPARLAAVRSRYAAGRDYLLYVGTVQPRKNLVGLLAAYERLRRGLAEPPLLVVAGKRGWLAGATYERAAALGDAVRFVDYVPQDDLVALLSGALALAFPSFYEGFGLPALEAMACGTPVVAARSSSLPEVVGDAGLLVDPHDTAALAAALDAVVRDAALRAALSQKGLARAAQFTWSRCAAATLRVLEEAAAS